MYIRVHEESCFASVLPAASSFLSTRPFFVISNNKYSIAIAKHLTQTRLRHLFRFWELFFQFLGYSCCSETVDLPENETVLFLIETDFPCASFWWSVSWVLFRRSVHFKNYICENLEYLVSKNLVVGHPSTCHQKSLRGGVKILKKNSRN